MAKCNKLVNTTNVEIRKNNNSVIFLNFWIFLVLERVGKTDVQTTSIGLVSNELSLEPKS